MAKKTKTVKNVDASYAGPVASAKPSGALWKIRGTESIVSHVAVKGLRTRCNRDLKVIGMSIPGQAWVAFKGAVSCKGCTAAKAKTTKKATSKKTATPAVTQVAGETFVSLEAQEAVA